MNQKSYFIVCMKWGKKFGADYVNRLYKMVKKNTTLPFIFICFTDDKTGIDKEIETRNLPAMDMDESLPERGWRKLSILKNDFPDLNSSALFLDLDIVIRDNIDDLLKTDKEFVIIKDWDFPNDIIGNSSVFKFEFNKHNDVYEYFINNIDEIRKKFRNEQAYLSYKMHEKNILLYWDETWCVSFKRQCLYPFPLNFFLTAREPQEAKIIVFHGRPTPQQAQQGYWGKIGLRYVKPVKWLEKYR